MSGSCEDGMMWVAYEIVDDGEVDLLGGHIRGLGDEIGRGGGMGRKLQRFTKGIIYPDVIVYSHGLCSAS